MAVEIAGGMLFLELPQSLYDDPFGLKMGMKSSCSCNHFGKFIPDIGYLGTEGRSVEVVALKISLEMGNSQGPNHHVAILLANINWSVTTYSGLAKICLLMHHAVTDFTGCDDLRQAVCARVTRFLLCHSGTVSGH